MSVADDLRSITIQNAGPISGTFEAELGGPGLYELRGSKGTGKTTVLKTLSMVSGHKSMVTVHDGELAGSVSAFGVIVPLGSRKRPRGECVVESLDSMKYTIEDLIDPDGKTPETRDATRIKALAALCSLELKPTHFHELVGGSEKYDALAVAETDDPVLFMNRIKASLDKQAKLKEEFGNSQKQKSSALASQAEGLDLRAPSDPDELAKSVELATVTLSTLSERARSAEVAIKAREEAKAQLEEARKSYDGPTVEQATDASKVVAQQIDEIIADNERIRKLLAEGEARLEKSREDYRLKLEVLRSAQQHQSDTESWQKTLDSEIDRPTEEELDAAIVAKANAQTAQENGVRIRDAQKWIADAERCREQSLKALSEAADFRAMSQEVFSVLTAQLATKVIRIESISGSPRLVVDHPRRKKTFFDQDDGLSDGERVRASVDELLPHLGSPGLFPIPQRTYQDLPPADRAELARYAQERGLYLFGAQVTDGELSLVRIHGESNASPT